MQNVEERPQGAKFRAVCLQNPVEARRWLEAVEEQLADLSAAVGDRVRKKRDRVLSRHEAKRQADEAFHALDQLLGAAKVGLKQADPPAPMPEPSTPEGKAR